MEARAIAKEVRTVPRKARLVIDLIRGKKVSEAYAILRNQPQKAARVIEKVFIIPQKIPAQSGDLFL